MGTKDIKTDFNILKSKFVDLKNNHFRKYSHLREKKGGGSFLELAQTACVRHACLCAPCVLACAMHSLAIVITNFRSFSFAVFCI